MFVRRYKDKHLPCFRKFRRQQIPQPWTVEWVVLHCHQEIVVIPINWFKGSPVKIDIGVVSSFDLQKTTVNLKFMCEYCHVRCEGRETESPQYRRTQYRRCRNGPGILMDIGIRTIPSSRIRNVGRPQK